MKMDLRRLNYDEQVRREKRKAGGSLIETKAASSLKPWREVVTPHQDVASGRYQQAEFAADLWQVHIGEGGAEYRDPAEFFRRTYLTESLKRLLVGGVHRLSGEGRRPGSAASDELRWGKDALHAGALSPVLWCDGCRTSRCGRPAGRCRCEYAPQG